LSENDSAYTFAGMAAVVHCSSVALRTVPAAVNAEPADDFSWQVTKLEGMKLLPVTSSTWLPVDSNVGGMNEAIWGTM